MCVYVCMCMGGGGGGGGEWAQYKEYITFYIFICVMPNILQSLFTEKGFQKIDSFLTTQCSVS